MSSCEFLTPSHPNPIDVDPFLNDLLFFCDFGFANCSIRVRQAKASRRPAPKSANAPLVLVVFAYCFDFSCGSSSPAGKHGH
jgi:hypothetical protein